MRTRSHIPNEEEEVSKQIQLLDCLSLQWSSPSVSNMDLEQAPSYSPHFPAPSSSSSLSLRTRHSVCAVYEEDLIDTIVAHDTLRSGLQVGKNGINQYPTGGKGGNSDEKRLVKGIIGEESVYRDWWSQPSCAFSASQCSSSCDAFLLAIDPMEILTDLDVDRRADDSDMEDDDSEIMDEDSDMVCIVCVNLCIYVSVDRMVGDVDLQVDVEDVDEDPNMAHTSMCKSIYV
jgi:hypothetical protein